MPLILTEEQSMLKSSAKEFLKDRSPVEALRKLRDSRDSYGYDRHIWKEMAEMGWAGLTIPENYGGLAFGYAGLGQVLQETGRTLTASPLVSNVLLAAPTLLKAGSEEQKSAFLPEIAEGKLLMTLAFEEGIRHQPELVETTAEKTATGYHISGKKVFVLDGHVADKFIVTARTSGDAADRDGISLFVIDAESAGVQVERTIMMDGRNAATVEFSGVGVSADALIGKENGGFKVLDEVLDVARIGLAAEMLGSMEEAFDRTVSYLKERQQFGKFIGSFQALQHRAALMYCEIELCKTAVLKGLQAIDAESKELSALASLAKAKTSSTIQLVTNEGVQMHGGIGMTDDEEIGFFLKRARVAQQTFGDENFHLDRYARILGF